VLITFRTPTHGDVTMFGDVALELIRLMGHSGTVPGALAPEDVSDALERLRTALRSGKGAEPTPSAAEEEAEEEEVPVPLLHRALPLIELLAAADRDGQYVMWDAR
jgi:hypothetical protein